MSLEKFTGNQENKPKNFLRRMLDTLRNTLSPAVETPVELTPETPVLSHLELPVMNPYKSPTEARDAEDFEAQLFQYGTLSFNPELVEQELARRLKAVEKRDSRRPTSNHIQHNDELRRTRNRMKEYSKWLEKYQGKVPQHWDLWYRIIYDIHAAKKLGIALNSTLLEAAQSHPNWQVGAELLETDDSKMKTTNEN